MKKTKKRRYEKIKQGKKRRGVKQRKLEGKCGDEPHTPEQIGSSALPHNNDHDGIAVENGQ